MDARPALLRADATPTFPMKELDLSPRPSERNGIPAGPYHDHRAAARNNDSCFFHAQVHGRMDYESVQPLRIERDPDRERASSSEATVTAVGARYPSGDIIIQWRREAFEQGERAKAPVTSHYRNEEDAEQASAGTLVFES